MSEEKRKEKAVEKRVGSNRLFDKWQIATVLLVLVISAATHLPNLAHPEYVVFDETHFGGFASDYIRGICFFDIHPPLAKLMIAGVAKLSGYDGSFNFSAHGSKYPSHFYVPMRALPAVLSTLIAPLMTATLCLNGCHCSAAMLVGIIMSVEFTSIVQGRLILTDGILYFFVALTMFFTALMERRQTYTFLILQSLAAACTLSIKFTGACVLALVALSHMRLVYGRKLWFAHLVIRGAIVFVICVTVLFTTIYIHLKLMPNPGFGDQYMAADFRKQPMLKRILLLIWAMYRYNRNLNFTHPYQSQWWEGPFWLAQPTLLFAQGNEILCIFNNPLAAFGSLAGFFFGLTSWNFQYSFGYFAAYAPLVLVSRCMWTYHYEIPLMFGLMALCYSISRLPRKWRLSVCVLLTALAIIPLLIWFPWLYAYPLSTESHKKRMVWEAMRKNWGY